MCGRFTLRTPTEKLVKQFMVEAEPEQQQLPLRFNVAPTQEVAVVKQIAGHPRQLTEMRWGLVPFWADDLKIGAKMINARSESVAEKPAFSRAFQKRRCLILSDGYYEWKKEGSKKQPYYIRMADGRPFAFAGLWEKWRAKDQQDGPAVQSCTIITTESNELTEWLHERMPVILGPNDYDPWLDNHNSKREQLDHLLQPYPSDEMIVERVSMKVNSVANDDAECISVQRELF